MLCEKLRKKSMYNIRASILQKFVLRNEYELSSIDSKKIELVILEVNNLVFLF